MKFTIKKIAIAIAHTLKDTLCTGCTFILVWKLGSSHRKTDVFTGSKSVKKWDRDKKLRCCLFARRSAASSGIFGRLECPFVSNVGIVLEASRSKTLGKHLGKLPPVIYRQHDETERNDAQA